MNLFVDASVVLAACGRPAGASRAVFDLAKRNGWVVMVSPYVISEVTKNLPRLSSQAALAWAQLRGTCVVVSDVWTMDRPAVFGPSKDRPVLFTASAWTEVLLTLDRGDFGAVMGTGFYGLTVLTPGDFLEKERIAQRLK